MAKRRRLEAPTSAPLETKPRGRAAPPPIAQVAGDAAAMAAAQDIVGEVEKARNEGRLVISVPLDDIAVDHLVRDRMSADDEDMAALKASIQTHGQRTPIEVVKTGQTYGLISGWRRLAALRALSKETGDTAFGTIKALIRDPQDAGAAYVAMVEENEIRVGLSYYERARIAVLAAARGAFASPEDAVDALYASGSRAKRSKIRSFMGVHAALGDQLQFPAHISERLGLQIATALKGGKGPELKKTLATPAKSAPEELAKLARALSTPAPKTTPEIRVLREDLKMQITGSGAARKIVLTGEGVTDRLIERLKSLATDNIFSDE